MQQSFDYFHQAEIPNFILCNPSGSQLFSLGTIYDREYRPRYNALGEISFTAPYSISGSPTEYYSFLTYKRLVYMPGIGYFIISDVQEDNDGILKEKKIVAKSLEAEMTYKKLSKFKGTYEFYDPFNPSGSSTLLGAILPYIPGWSIGTVDAPLYSLYRTFDISDSTIYEFLMTDVEEAYQCIFTFDTLAKTISAYTVPNATTTTDIYMSFNNLVESVSVTEITSELVTALNVYGKGDLSINTVNPLGTNTIYNFDYYKTTDWMSSELIASLNLWEAKIVLNQPIYASLLTSLRTSGSDLIFLQNGLVDLQTQLATAEGVKSARIKQGLSITAINVQIRAINASIVTQRSLILSKQSSISGIQQDLAEINAALSFSTNFSDELLLELDPFIVGQTYNNENFVQTDLMTNIEIQDTAQDLYDQAQDVLVKISQPRYEFGIDAVNFILLEEFQRFTNQLVLGAVITLELDSGTIVSPALLGIDLNYDDPTQFKLTFGNRLRLDNSSFIFTDLFGQITQQGITTSFNSEQWSNWNTNYLDPVSTFISSALNAATNNLISGSTQNILINQNGIRIRSMLGSGSYSPQQLWMNNGIIAFSDDDFETAKLALGQVTTPTGGSAFGLVAQQIVGNLIAGNELRIANSGSTFIVDGAGATLTNANMTLNTTGGQTKILLDPTRGIAIQKNVGGTWTDQFYVDSSGNVIFKGTLSAASGTFSGTITASTIVGGTISGTTGTFSGNIFAANIQNQLTNAQIASVSADKVSAGTIYGSSIGWPGVTMYTNGAGISLIDAATSLSIYGGNSSLSLQNGVATLIATSFNISVNNLYIEGYGGKTASFTLRNTAGGTNTLYFRKGLLTSYT